MIDDHTAWVRRLGVGHAGDHLQPAGAAPHLLVEAVRQAPGLLDGAVVVGALESGKVSDPIVAVTIVESVGHHLRTTPHPWGKSSSESLRPRLDFLSQPLRQSFAAFSRVFAASLGQTGFTIGA